MYVVLSPLTCFITFCISIAILVEVNYIRSDIKSFIPKQQDKETKKCATNNQYPCAKNWIGLNDKCYLYVNSASNWNNSVLTCESMESVLYVPKGDTNALQVLKMIVNYNGDTWLGGIRRSYQPWKDPYGNIITVGSDIRSSKNGCVFIKRSGTVTADINCNAEKNYICEKSMQ
ncbi:C-type lectin-like protein [Fowlpox virus]|nr:C-type lectin-like protein [Fowlpox virus]